MNLLWSDSQMTLDFASDVQRAIILALAEAQHQHSPVLGMPHLFISLPQEMLLDQSTTIQALRWQIRESLTRPVIQGEAR